ncbi:MAG: sulfate ABC transporter substrate-binding protein [Thermoanaerobaculia bacterium]
MTATRRLGVWLGAVSLVACGFAACKRETPAPGGAAATSKTTTLLLGAYTTPREVYRDAILPAFEKAWKAKGGGAVEFRTSYQGSGAQARAIIGGFEADVAALALAPDIDRIATEKLITHDWKARPHGGMVTNSIVVIAVRKGNPAGIKDWPDLTRKGLNVLTPDPKTSGGAMWNINAIYGAALRGHTGVPANDPAAAAKFLSSVFKNVSIMDKGARESITTFEKGVGDVAITYENEVLTAQAAGEPLEYVVPKSTILIQNPAAVVDTSVDKHRTREAATAFLDFVVTPDAQRAFAKFGFRPVDADVAKESEGRFPRVEDLWTIEALGGWPKVLEEIYGPQGIWTKVFAEKSTTK